MIPSARWVGGAAVVAAMLLGLGAAAHAKDCTRATPLPADTTITPPAADVPGDLAKFSGAWGGVWTVEPRDDGPCTTPPSSSRTSLSSRGLPARRVRR